MKKKQVNFKSRKAMMAAAKQNRAGIDGNIKVGQNKSKLEEVAADKLAAV